MALWPIHVEVLLMSRVWNRNLATCLLRSTSFLCSWLKLSTTTCLTRRASVAILGQGRDGGGIRKVLTELHRLDSKEPTVGWRWWRRRKAIFWLFGPNYAQPFHEHFRWCELGGDGVSAAGVGTCGRGFQPFHPHFWYSWAAGFACLFFCGVWKRSTVECKFVHSVSRVSKRKETVGNNANTSHDKFSRRPSANFVVEAISPVWVMVLLFYVSWTLRLQIPEICNKPTKFAALLVPNNHWHHVIHAIKQRRNEPWLAHGCFQWPKIMVTIYKGARAFTVTCGVSWCLIVWWQFFLSGFTSPAAVSPVEMGGIALQFVIFFGSPRSTTSKLSTPSGFVHVLRCPKCCDLATTLRTSVG